VSRGETGVRNEIGATIGLRPVRTETHHGRIQGSSVGVGVSPRFRNFASRDIAQGMSLEELAVALPTGRSV